MNTGQIIVFSGIALMFCLQLFVLFKSNRWSIRLIPLYLYIPLGIYAFLCSVGIFGGDYFSSRLVAFMIGAMMLYWLIGVIAAWVVYAVVIFILKRKT